MNSKIDQPLNDALSPSGPRVETEQAVRESKRGA